jgi:hypothetical protein
MRDVFSDMLISLDGGLCVAAVAQEEPWKWAQAEHPELHCNKAMVGGVLLDQGIAMPVRSDIETALSYIIARHITEGQYEELSRAWLMDQLPENVCTQSMEGAEGDEQEGFQSLGISHLLGPFMITFTCTTLGLMVYFFVGYAIEDVVALGQAADNLGGQANMLASDSKLRKEMKNVSFQRLWERAKAADVPDEELNAALDAAPEKSLLIKAVFKYECSEVRRRLIGLQAHTVSELIHVATAVAVDDGRLTSALNQPKYPKRDLIKLILNTIDIDGDGVSLLTQPHYVEGPTLN